MDWTGMDGMGSNRFYREELLGRSALEDTNGYKPILRCFTVFSNTAKR
jgi:hypothetical protein